jgi:hypothetical protein
MLMTWRTHLVGGVCSLAPLLLLPPESLAPGEAGLLALVACLGALLPDLDAGESHLKAPAADRNRSCPVRPDRYAAAPEPGPPRIAPLARRSWSGRPAPRRSARALAGIARRLALVLGYASHLALDAGTKAAFRCCSQTRPGATCCREGFGSRPARWLRSPCSLGLPCSRLSCCLGCPRSAALPPSFHLPETTKAACPFRNYRRPFGARYPETGKATAQTGGRGSVAVRAAGRNERCLAAHVAAHVAAAE